MISKVDVSHEAVDSDSCEVEQDANQNQTSSPSLKEKYLSQIKSK